MGGRGCAAVAVVGVAAVAAGVLLLRHSRQARGRRGGLHLRERGGKCGFAAGEEALRAPLLLIGGVRCSRWTRGRGGGWRRDGRAVHG